MDKFLVKDLVVYSLIFGILTGVLSVIPYVGMLMLFMILLFTAPVVILYMIMAGKLDLTNIKDSIIWGAICGFSGNLTFCAGACIVLVLLKIGFDYSSNYLLTTMVMNSPIWLTAICVIFLSTLVATTNAFSGFITYYALNFIRDSYERTHKSEKNNDNFKNYME
ncbi:hypothetical protein IJ596_04470 [bacterium]|nr:hypothetical protein [bacterium]